MQMETDYGKARDFYTQAFQILQAHPDCDKIPVVNLLTSLAEVHTRLGSYQQAHEVHQGKRVERMGRGNETILGTVERLQSGQRIGVSARGRQPLLCMGRAFDVRK